jgi:hypothetical protein
MICRYDCQGNASAHLTNSLLHKIRIAGASSSNSKYDFGGLMLVVKTGRHT